MGALPFLLFVTFHPAIVQGRFLFIRRDKECVRGLMTNRANSRTVVHVVARGGRFLVKWSSAPGGVATSGEPLGNHATCLCELYRLRLNRAAKVRKEGQVNRVRELRVVNRGPTFRRATQDRCPRVKVIHVGRGPLRAAQAKGRVVVRTPGPVNPNFVDVLRSNVGTP